MTYDTINDAVTMRGESGSALGRIDIGKRNPLLVDTLERIGRTENRNSGIATMREECARAGLPPPEFSVVTAFPISWHRADSMNHSGSFAFGRSAAASSSTCMVWVQTSPSG